MTTPTPAPWETCIHREAGLCGECQAACDEDFDAWIEFGDHVEGIRRWEARKKEIAAEAVQRQGRHKQPDPDMPF